jgi:hypothetical protein
VTFLGAASQPRYAVAHQISRVAGLVARGIETHVSQHHQDMHGGIPPAGPRATAPPPVDRLEGEQRRAGAFGADSRTAETASAEAPIRSCITCQRIEGSESSSQLMTDLSGFCARRSSGFMLQAYAALREFPSVGSL